MLNGRDPRIDFFRGLALIFIFWDHVPHNPLANVTVQNFGFSDAAEIFVFLAGYAAVLAYGKILQRDGYFIACLKILRRVWTLYVVHIFLLALLMGIVIFANSHIETRDLVQEMGLEYFLNNTQQALVDELLLRFKPNLTDPLPLYIVLILSLPLTLPLLLRVPKATVAISLVVYLLAPWQGWNLPASNGGVWYFNPITWQCLFILGGAAALRSARPTVQQPLLRQPLFIAAAAYVLTTCMIALSWRWPDVHDAWMPHLIGEWLYPISKTDLSPVRLLHFLALAYVTAKLLPGVGWTQHWLAQQLTRMGRYSLEVFCLGVVLAPLADMVNAVTGDSFAIRLVTAVVGAVVMALFAAWLEFNKRLDQRRSTAPPSPAT
ncbi:hypothetical protein SAMN04490190_2820 [Pseudomonas libanensis]|uniref:Membrane protein n=1 Tax=Pseudomonas libanensis TaxID=75588 RepID=A0A0R2YDH0_9PSED|nr:OpgC domain-containing protein [Pseudomonas libanensis]KRP46474.1 membrane protein [Pseudomonas libanensis]SDL00465.1 hypothetical protein SAMN04490190_2820 [Pseudomonas libanensis]